MRRSREDVEPRGDLNREDKRSDIGDVIHFFIMQNFKLDIPVPDDVEGMIHNICREGGER